MFTERQISIDFFFNNVIFLNIREEFIRRSLLIKREKKLLLTSTLNKYIYNTIKSISNLVWKLSIDINSNWFEPT